MKQSLRRTMRAQLRHAQVLFAESRTALLLFAAVVLGGGLIFRLFYTFPETARHPGALEALHASSALIFFDTVLPFPEHWLLRVLFFVIPILGFAVVADGVIHFGAALVNKHSRGQKWEVAMASTFSGHVVVCGIGKVGHRVILELLTRRARLRGRHHARQRQVLLLHRR